MYKPEWLKYTLEQRQKLAEHFNIKKSGAVEVFDNVVVNDGYPDEAIYKIDKKDADKLLGLNQNAKDETIKTTKKEGATVKKPVSKKDEGSSKA